YFILCALERHISEEQNTQLSRFYCLIFSYFLSDRKNDLADTSHRKTYRETYFPIFCRSSSFFDRFWSNFFCLSHCTSFLLSLASNIIIFFCFLHPFLGPVPDLVTAVQPYTP